jgi:hypothetical protein
MCTEKMSSEVIPAILSLLIAALSKGYISEKRNVKRGENV